MTTPETTTGSYTHYVLQKDPSQLRLADLQLAAYEIAGTNYDLPTLAGVIQAKMAYNTTRPIGHGKKNGL